MLRRLYLLLALCPLSICLAEPVRINEFLADNTATSLQDEDLDTPDWIEFYNPAGAPVSLAGWSLTDDAGDLTKWQFPAVSIPAHGYLLVFASGKNRAPTNGDPLHASFVLAQAGEYVALVGPDGTSVISEFGPGGSNYPEQRPDITYGIFGSPGQVGFLFNPTPGAANDDSSAVLGFVDDTEFDIDRGFFMVPFYVTITTSTPGATIRYTTDGSWPSESVGTIYTEPVLVRRTLPLKAIAYKPGSVSSNVDTQTYISVDNVVTQTTSNTQSLWGLPSSWGGQAPYYGMNGNPRIDPLTHPLIKDNLKQIPSFSIAMETDDLFGSNGIYSNPGGRGPSWERPTSLEFIDPRRRTGSHNFQQNCAIRIQGGGFRSFGLSPKKSFRVLFKSDYGPSNLPTGGPGKLSYPLFGPDAASEFQTLTFRLEGDDGWQSAGLGSEAQYARDEFGRRLQLALGQPSSHGLHCHLYLNGVYWGIYNVVERPDSGFAESYFGINRELWQGRTQGGPINDNTNLNDWNAMLGAVSAISSASTILTRDRFYLRVCGFSLGGARYPFSTVWVDPNNFADYLLANWYGGNSDWPHANYYCGRDPGAESTGYKFFNWDYEWSLRILRFHLTTNLTNNFAGVAEPQRHLETSPEYRVRFGDRAHAALFNDGIFVPENATALYEEITAQHLNFLYPEAARWGNQHGHAHTPSTWRAERSRLVHPTTGWFVQRPAILLAQLKARGLYPALAAPTFSPHGGSIPAGSGPTLSVPDNITKVYYMYGPGDGDLTDYAHSLDPRLVLGAINPAATLIDFGSAGNGNGVHTSPPLALTEPGYLLSRSYNSASGEWSALNTALFTLDTIPANAGRIVVSEIHYHPEAPRAAEIAAGFADQDLFEFLEVQNIGSASADMTGVDFIAGLEFEFPPGFTLAPGARAVIVKDLAAFNYRYPGFPASQIAGVFLNDSGLRNSGETLTMRAADGSLIKDFAYDDESPWPSAPDGTGVSLVLMFAETNPNPRDSTIWRPAAASGGNPGETDVLVFAGDPNADQDGDGVLAYVEHALGTSDRDPAERETMKFGAQTIEISGNLDDYFTITFSRDLRAEDVEIVPQVSADMIDWNAGPVTPVTVSEVTSSGTRVEVTYRLSAPLGSHESLFVRLLVRAR